MVNYRKSKEASRSTKVVNILRCFCVFCHPPHILGKATGFVTTSRVTHATPAALYAHSPDRYWEDDEDVPSEERALGCTDIGAQLVENGKMFEVSEQVRPDTWYLEKK